MKQNGVVIKITQEMFKKLNLHQKLVAMLLEENKKLICVNERGDRVRVATLLQGVTL